MKTLEDRQRECSELYKSGYPAKATPAATVRNDKAEALRRMREIHAAGRMPLSNEEAIEFLKLRFWLGAPQRIKAGQRGRPPTRTQYDDFLARRKSGLHKLEHLPKIAHLGGAGKSKKASIASFVAELKSKYPTRKLTGSFVEREMLRGWKQEGVRVPSVDTIRRVLAETREKKN